MNLRLKVFEDCSKLLDNKYKWLTYYHYNTPYPEFKLPIDPTIDIKNIIKYEDIVNKESKGWDPGHCYYAAKFKEGYKVYRSNINVLTSLNKDWPSNLIKPSDNDTKLAIERWMMLEDACHKCTNMMRQLHSN